MRIVAGKYGGRKFHPPENIPTRPTTDFARTGLFNILNNEFDFPEISFLDLFAGTGAMSFEMASRGSTDITCVDQNVKCIGFIDKVAKEWNIEGLKATRTDVYMYLDRCSRKFDLILADPPYTAAKIETLPDLIFEKQLLNDGGWFVLETSVKHAFQNHPRFFHQRDYGTTQFHLFK
jgi:16S rRNA (guanine966-N2)-methyltransferase